MSDVDASPPAQRRRLNDAAGSSGLADSDDVEHAASADMDDVEGEPFSSYNEDYAELYGGCASQTDNPNTPLGHHRNDHGQDGPRLRYSKSIQDRVHGQIALGGLLVAVMDTAEFQRLDRVRQLGGCYFVYPSATHTRKEHSIGVAHLAGYMARHLAKQQPELEIDESDVLCVELAGLVHDLGHGPFSHMFEDYMKQIDQHKQPKPPKWEHEDMSAKLLRRLLEQNNVPVADYFVDCDAAQAEAHINFVVKLIEGLRDDAPWPENIGRSPRKRFLFDIVNNKRNGVDVDKLDYLVRDSMAAFGSSCKVPGFDIYRIITSSSVLNRKGDPNSPQVCFQVKNALEILEIYALRAKLHRQVYQHRIANVTEAMITDVFLAADKHFRVKGGPGSAAGGVPLSEAAHDTDAFVRLNDSILDALDMSTEEGLGEAHALLARLKRRDFYRQVGSQVNIETLPMCANPHCRKGTPIDARYCLQCGETTSTRPHARFVQKSGSYVSYGVVLSEADVRRQLLAKLQPEVRTCPRPSMRARMCFAH